MDAEGNSPADGIGPVDRLDGVELGQLKNGGDPQQPQAAGAHQGHQHGHDGVADAAQAAHHHVHHAAEGIGGADDAHPHQSGLNDRGTGGVDGQQYPTCQRGGVAQHQPHHQHAALGADHDLADAVVVTGAVVLAGEGNGGLIHGVHRHVYELLNVGRSGVAGHDDLTEGIDGGLDHHVGQGEENPLESGGQADAEDLPHGLGVEPHLLEIQVQRAGILHHAAEHQGGGDALGDHGGDGHTCHVQLADDDEEEIQHDVDDSRQGEEVQRPLGIALRPQQGGAEVVDHGGRHAQEVDPQIQRGQIQHVLRGLHPDQDGPGTEDAHHCQHQAADDAQQDGGVDYPVERVSISGAVVFGRQGIGTHGQAHKQVGQQADQRGVGPHCRQGVVPGPAAHHHDIRRVEQ